MSNENITALDEVTVPALALQLMAQNAADTAHTTNTLLDSYQHQIAHLQAELELIRERMYALLDEDYMPSASAIERALRPRADLIARRAAENGGA